MATLIEVSLLFSEIESRKRTIEILWLRVRMIISHEGFKHLTLSNWRSRLFSTRENRSMLKDVSDIPCSCSGASVTALQAFGKPTPPLILATAQLIKLIPNSFDQIIEVQNKRRDISEHCNLPTTQVSLPELTIAWRAGGGGAV